MIIVYTPEDGEPEQYDVKALVTSEASIVSRTIEQTWNQIKDGLGEDDLDAMRGIVWILKKRHDPTLRFGAFDPPVTSLETRMDKPEIVDYIRNAVEIRDTQPEIELEQIAYALRDLPDAAADPEHARTAIREMTTEAPKDPEPEPGQLPGGPEPLPGSSPGPSSTSTPTGPST